MNLFDGALQTLDPQEKGPGHFVRFEKLDVFWKIRNTF